MEDQGGKNDDVDQVRFRLLLPIRDRLIMKGRTEGFAAIAGREYYHDCLIFWG